MRAISTPPVAGWWLNIYQGAGDLLIKSRLHPLREVSTVFLLAFF